MEFTFTFWSWFGLIGNLVTMVVSLAILLVMVGLVRWHRANLWLSLLLISLFGQVACGQLTNVLFWLDQGNPLHSFWISLSLFSASGVLLFAFAGNLIGLRGWVFRAVLTMGALGWLIVTFLILQGTVVTDVSLNETGLLRYDITALGYALSALPFIYQFAALGLLIYNRKRLSTDNLVILGVGALMIGPLLVVLQVERLIGAGIPYTALSLLVGTSILGYIVARRQLFGPLRQLTSELQHQVAERTHELEKASKNLRLANASLNRRVGQLQAVLNIALEIALAPNLDQLLQRAVELIHNHFGYFHVALYLVDDQGEWIVLRAVAGEVARLMKQTVQKLQIGTDTALGYVVTSGKPRLMFDVATLERIESAEQPERDASISSAGHSPHPSGTLLPGARSGLVLPLKVGTQTIGALDLQSVEDTFLEEEEPVGPLGGMEVLQTLADYLALAIENARLLRRTEAQLDELTTLYRRYSQQVWQELPTSLAVAYRQGQMQTLRALPWSVAHRAWSVEGEETEPEGDEKLLTIPVKLRDETIGVLGFRKEEASTGWSASERALVEAVASQMALALENVRLYQEAQQLAQREQTLNQMTALFARSIDIDTVLQTAVRELGKLPNVAEVSVHVGPPEAPPSANPTGMLIYGDKETDHA
jgi:GAF domain-containing protein